MTPDAMRFKNYARFTFIKTGEGVPLSALKAALNTICRLNFDKGSCNIVSFFDGSRDAA
jgi:hypothetical protein